MQNMIIMCFYETPGIPEWPHMCKLSLCIESDESPLEVPMRTDT